MRKQQLQSIKESQLEDQQRQVAHTHQQHLQKLTKDKLRDQIEAEQNMQKMARDVDRDLRRQQVQALKLQDQAAKRAYND